MLGFGRRRRLFSALLQVQKRPCQPSRNMRLVQFQAPHLEEPHLGLESEVGGGVVDLNAFDSTLPKTMVQFLEQGETTLSVARRALATQLPVIPRSQVTFLAPVTRPDKVICVGLNYADHCQEQNVRVPKNPIIFSKFSSSIVGPYDEIILPPESKEVDWEVEMAVVIGKKGKHIKATDVMAHVAGFTVAHDVSARDWQMRNGKQWLLGKTFDTFCPLGPALVTKDTIADPHNLKICCRVNGEVVQSSNTNQMVFKTEDLIAWVSQFVTLYPGDLLLTGTPPGVGMFRKPPVFLKEESDATEGPCNPLPAPTAPTTWCSPPQPTACPNSSDYLVFSSFTRITLQKPRSIMLLWKRDSQLLGVQVWQQRPIKGRYFPRNGVMASIFIPKLEDQRLVS